MTADAAISAARSHGVSKRPSYASSLPTKPSIGGNPAALTPATTAATHVHGIARPSPRSLVTSRVPASWSTEPATMNSGALYSECANRKTTIALIAAGVPTPMSSTRVPSAINVLYASSRLLSRCSSASAAAARIVAPPASVSNQNQSGVPPSPGARRASR